MLVATECNRVGEPYKEKLAREHESKCQYTEVSIQRTRQDKENATNCDYKKVTEDEDKERRLVGSHSRKRKQRENDSERKRKLAIKHDRKDACLVADIYVSLLETIHVYKKIYKEPYISPHT